AVSVMSLSPPANHSTKPRREHCLSCNKLRNSPSPEITTPILRPYRQRRKRIRRATKLATQPASPECCRVVRPVAGGDQPQTLPARTPAIDQIQRPAHPPTRAWAPPVRLLSVDARLPDDLKPPLDAVNDNVDLLARETGGWRLGYPWRIFDGWPRSFRPTFSEREHL